MANKYLLTYGSKIQSVKQDYFNPVVVLPTNTGVNLNTLYFFLAKVDPWTNENNPPNPQQSQQYIKQTLKNMFVAKRITSNDVSPVLERIDWSTNTVYDYYNDTVDMFAIDTGGYLIKRFYVKNKYDQVFKCLWNANNGISTVEPYFEPGTYGSNGIFQGADGYKWKFMYYIDSGLKIKFMDKNWIPVPISANTPSALVTTAGAGSIDTINIVNGGSNYNPSIKQITVKITGDGTGAAATIGLNEVANGQITDIVVTSSGSNYTYANVAITSDLGSNASAVIFTSPIGGHGYDPKSELGCSHSMISVEFSGTENGYIPVDIDYHQVGIVLNPTAKNVSPNPANGTIYKTTTDLVLAPGFGAFIQDERVFQVSVPGDSYENAIFTGTVLSFDTASNVLRLINTTGSLTTNASVYGNTSKATRTLLTYSLSNYVNQSGYVSYIENRTGVQRSIDGIEQYKVVLGY